MKLLFQEPINIPKNETSDTDIRDFLSDNCIWFSEDNFFITIKEQKSTLNEEVANTLFFDFIDDYVTIDYASLGGEGCDFSLNIKQKTIHPQS